MGKVYVASQKAPAAVGLVGGIPGMPWVDPAKFAAGINAGIAGKMNHQALEKSKSTGIKV